MLCVSSEEPENVEKFQKRLVKVTPEHNEECKKLLQLMGVPFIEVSLMFFIINVIRDITIILLSRRNYRKFFL